MLRERQPAASPVRPRPRDSGTRHGCHRSSHPESRQGRRYRRRTAPGGPPGRPHDGEARMRMEFDAEPAKLEGMLQEAGSATVRGIDGALVALQDWEPGVLDYLCGIDDRVDGLYRQIERDVETLIARQAPVATDLRIVLGVLQTNAHIERMSHNCVRIGRLA